MLTLMRGLPLTLIMAYLHRTFDRGSVQQTYVPLPFVLESVPKVISKKGLTKPIGLGSLIPS